MGHLQADSIIYSHCCKNLNSCIYFVVCKSRLEL